MQQDPLGLLALIAGMTLVILGLIQYIAQLTKNGDKKRAETFDLLEAEKLENVRLQGQLFVYDQKVREMQGYARKYYRLYRKYESMYHREVKKNETVQTDGTEKPK